MTSQDITGSLMVQEIFLVNWVTLDYVYISCEDICNSNPEAGSKVVIMYHINNTRIFCNISHMTLIAAIAYGSIIYLAVVWMH